jgi:hypothetical protein
VIGMDEPHIDEREMVSSSAPRSSLDLLKPPAVGLACGFVDRLAGALFDDPGVHQVARSDVAHRV